MLQFNIHNSCEKGSIITYVHVISKLRNQTHTFKINQSFMMKNEGEWLWVVWVVKVFTHSYNIHTFKYILMYIR